MNRVPDGYWSNTLRFKGNTDPEKFPDSEPETVSPIEQLAFSLRWEEEYTDAYKVRVVTEAIKFLVRGA